MPIPKVDPLTGRRTKYLDTYAHALTASYRVQQIRSDIQNEQAQVQYIDSLLAQAQQTAAGLEAAFQAQPPASLEAATALLKQQYDSQDQQRRRQAAEGVSYARATGLTPEDRLSITPSGNLSKTEALANAERILRDPKTTPEKASAVRAAASERLAGTPGLERLAAAEGAVAAAGGARRQVQGARALTPQEAADQEVLNQLFEATYFAGASGIVGGYDGKAIADLRASTPAPKNTSFATAEDAFSAALGAVRNGSLTREDFESDDDYAYAKEIYSEAKAKKAYRNDQRADFETAVLTARKEVADLEKKRAEQIGTTYDDPAQEGIRRELTARGYSFVKKGAPDEWKNAYVKLQKTPDYNAYIRAHERVLDARTNATPLAPSNRVENIVTTFTMMKNRRGESFGIEDLRRQLDKVGIEGKLQDEAVAFGLAYWELGGPEQDPEMLKQQKEAEDLRTQDELRREEAARAAKTEVANARIATKQLEQEQVAAVEARRGEQAESNRLFDEYKKLLAEGYTKEQARFAVQEFSKKPTPMGAAPQVFLGTDLADAKTAIQDARREFPPASPPASRIYEGTKPAPRDFPRVQDEEELVFGGGVVPPEPEPAMVPKKPVSRPPARTAPSAKPAAEPAAKPAAKPAKPAVLDPGKKASERLLDEMDKLEIGSEQFNRAADQYNKLIQQGN
jgi:hypothetical protein